MTEPATWQRIDLPGADLRLLPQFLAAEEADQTLDRLLAEIPFSQPRIRLFGRERPIPRLSCWIGDSTAIYSYSGTRFDPQPWTPTLQALRERVAGCCGAAFNSVLANCYRNGQDSMGWHADDEPELGEAPLIASLSLGASRRFLLRSRDRQQRRALELAHGSLLLMAGTTQQNFQHALPKTARRVGCRINLTFRWVAPSRQRSKDHAATAPAR